MNPYFLYKISYKLNEKSIPILPKLITYFIRLIFGCYLPYTAKIGQQFIIGYGGIGVVIHSRAIIGNNVKISQNVTIGGTNGDYGVPIIGNDVIVGAGAVIIGDIIIGSGSVIGANTVVTKDIPERSLVVGIPGIVKKTNINIKEYI